SSRRRHTRSDRDWSSDVCSSDLPSSHGAAAAFTFTPPAAPCELGEAQAKALLAQAGIDVNEGVVVRDEREARQSAPSLGYPLAQIGRASCRERGEGAGGGGGGRE